MTFGEKIKEARLAMNLSQTELDVYKRQDYGRYCKSILDFWI